MVGNIGGAGEAENIRGAKEAKMKELGLTKKGKAALDTPIHSLKQLKQVLISAFGEKRGKELFHKFESSLIESVFVQIQASIKRAQAAAKKMRQS